MTASSEALQTSANSQGEFRYVNHAQLYESPLNPRRHWDEKRLQELAESIRAQGVLAPLIVRYRPNPNGPGEYEIGAGHRRYRAAGIAEHDPIPVIVKAMTDAEFLELLTFENLQREDIHPLDEAAGYGMLMTELHYDVEAVAARIGKSTSYVYQRLKLTELIEPAQQAFLQDEMTAGHAILLARLQPEDQARALKECVDFDWDDENHRRTERLASVRELARWIEDQVHLDLQKAVFSKKAVDLVPAAGACMSCTKRTGFISELFPDVKKKDTCTDPLCFQAKVAAHVAKRMADLTLKLGVPPVELSTHYHRKEKGGALPGDKWEEVQRDAPCQYAATGLVVDGPRDLGKVLQVCTEPTCKVHGGEYGSSVRDDDRGWREKQRKEREKTQREEKRRVLILDAVLPKVTETLSRPVLELVAGRLWTRLMYDDQKRVAARYGWEFKTNDYHDGRNKTVRKQIAEMSDIDLARWLITAAMIGELQVGYGSEKAEALNALADLYGVDVSTITVEEKKSAKGKRKVVLKRESHQNGTKPKKQKVPMVTPRSPAWRTSGIAIAVTAGCFTSEEESDEFAICIGFVDCRACVFSPQLGVHHWAAVGLVLTRRLARWQNIRSRF